MEIYTWTNLINVVFPGLLLQISSCFSIKANMLASKFKLASIFIIQLEAWKFCPLDDSYQILQI